jgi:adenine phosphoribosyltransferase
MERNTAAAEAKRRRAEQGVTLRDRLVASFCWRGDSTDRGRWADITGWWRDPEILGSLGPAIAALYPDARPTVILGPQSRGMLVGGLVATSLGLGMVEVRKDEGPSADSDAWRQRTTPPDYRDRHLTLGFPKDLVKSGDQVLFVDDWIDTGGQALGVHGLVTDAGARWLGAAVIVDALTDPRLRRDLGVRALIQGRELDALP